MSKTALQQRNDALQQVFTDLVDGLKAEYIKSIRYRIISAIRNSQSSILGKTWRDAFGNGLESPYGTYSQLPFKSIIRNCYTTESTFHTSPLVMRKGTDIKRVVKREVDYMVSMLYDGFVNKNVKKLQHILKTGELQHTEGEVWNNLTGYLKVKVKTGGSFTMTFSIVDKVSNRGKWFQQFPTRFTDVQLSDGTQMTQPSEKKMKAEFK